jgi:hypothetical protein
LFSSCPWKYRTLVVVSSCTCTPPVFVFSALNNSHYFPLYSMTHNLINNRHGDLLYSTAISCLRQMANGLFILAYHSNAQWMCYSNLSVSLSLSLSLAMLGIPWHGSWCLHSQTLQLEIQINQVLWKGRRKWPATNSSVFLAKQIVAQLCRPLTEFLWNLKRSSSYQTRTIPIIYFVRIHMNTNPTIDILIYRDASSL